MAVVSPLFCIIFFFHHAAAAVLGGGGETNFHQMRFPYFQFSRKNHSFYFSILNFISKILSTSGTSLSYVAVWISGPNAKTLSPAELTPGPKIRCITLVKAASFERQISP